LTIVLSVLLPFTTADYPFGIFQQNIKSEVFQLYSWLAQEEFEDTKGAIRIRISKKNRQHNGQKKKYKRTNNDLQSMHIKLKIE
jgi:hypothetical protein